MQRLTLGNDVIFCAGRSGSTLFRSKANSVIFGNDLHSLTGSFHDPTLNFHLLIRHPIHRYLSGFFFEWYSHILPHWDEQIRKPLKDPMYSLNLYLEQIKKQICIPDPEHMGNWLVKLNYDFISKCRVWKFEEIDKLAKYVNIEFEVVNANEFLTFSYYELYSRLNSDLKIYINQYLKEEIATYYVILDSFYGAKNDVISKPLCN